MTNEKVPCEFCGTLMTVGGMATHQLHNKACKAIQAQKITESQVAPVALQIPVEEPVVVQAVEEPVPAAPITTEEVVEEDPTPEPAKEEVVVNTNPHYDPSKPQSNIGASSWEANKFDDQPWNPASILNAVLTDKVMADFGMRWVRPDKVDRRESEGWLFAAWADLKKISSATILDGAPMDTVVKKREMTLMIAHNSLLAKRDEYQEDQIQDPSKIAAEYRKKAQEEGTDVGVADDRELGATVTHGFSKQKANNK